MTNNWMTQIQWKMNMKIHCWNWAKTFRKINKGLVFNVMSVIKFITILAALKGINKQCMKVSNTIARFVIQDSLNKVILIDIYQKEDVLKLDMHSLETSLYKEATKTDTKCAKSLSVEVLKIILHSKEI